MLDTKAENCTTDAACIRHTDSKLEKKKDIQAEKNGINKVMMYTVRHNCIILYTVNHKKVAEHL